MEWLSKNLVWVLFAVGMIAMHLFGHGGHGGHSGGNEPKPTSDDGIKRAPGQQFGHRH